MEALTILPLPNGLYRLQTSQEHITLSAQDLRDLSDWTLRNLPQISKVTGEDEHLDESTRAKLDQLARALRESE